MGFFSRLVTDQVESTLLGTLIQFPSTISELGNRITPRDFFHPRNQYILEAMLHLFNEGHPVSAESLLAELDRRQILNKVGGAGYLTELISANTTADAASYYIGVVSGQSRVRRIRELGTHLQQASELDADDAVRAVWKFLEEAEVDRKSDSDDFDSAYASWEEWYDTETVAIPTPWPGINSMLHGGLHKGRLYTIAGRPGAGKSAMCLNAVLHAGQSGFKSVTYSLEMPSAECVSRILAAATGTPLKHIFQHRLSADDRARIENFATNRTRPLMKINDSPSQTIETIAADCRARKKSGLDLVAIDHSLLLDPSDKRFSEIQHINHVSRYAKLLARRLEIPVVLLHQLNRELEKRDKRKPRMADLHGGGEKDADVIIILDRDEQNNQIAAHLVKNRQGPKDRVASLIDELAYGRLG